MKLLNSASVNTLESPAPDPFVLFAELDVDDAAAAEAVDAGASYNLILSIFKLVPRFSVGGLK